MSRASSAIVRGAAPAVILLSVLAGCARSMVEEYRYGSIKDTPVSPRGASYTRPEPAPQKKEPVAKSAAAETVSTTAPKAPPPAPSSAATEPGPARPAIIRQPAVPATPPAPPATAKAPERATESTTPALGPVSAQAQSEASKRLLAEGNRLFAAGDVVKARERFLAAMNGPIPEVMLVFARSYDPYYLSRLPRSNAAPDPQRAVTIYEGAVRQGSTDAEADLQRLRKSLATSPAGTPIPPRSAPSTPPAAGQPAPAAAPPAVEPASPPVGTPPAATPPAAPPRQ